MDRLIMYEAAKDEASSDFTCEFTCSLWELSALSLSDKTQQFPEVSAAEICTYKGKQLRPTCGEVCRMAVSSIFQKVQLHQRRLCPHQSTLMTLKIQNQ